MLIIAEKDEAGKRIAQILSEILGFSMETEFINDIPIYHIGEITVISARGHLLELWVNLSGISTIPQLLEELPKRKLYWRVPKDARNRLLLIRELARKHDLVVVATDYDREGDVIGYNIVRFINKVHRNTNLRLDNIYDYPPYLISRMYFNMLTRDEIEKAFNNLTEMNESLLAQGLGRTIADTIFGLGLTKALTIRFKKVYPELRQAFSLGRVQSPLLSYITQETDATLSISFGNIYENEYKDVRVYLKVGEHYVEIPREFAGVKKIKVIEIIEKTEEKPQSEYLPNTDDVMQEFTRISPETLMSVLEALYLKGYSTYPRTKSRYLPKEVLEELISELRKHISLPYSFSADNYPPVVPEKKMAITLTKEGIQAYFDGKIKGKEKLVATYLIYKLIRSVAPPLRMKITIAKVTANETEKELIIAEEIENMADAISWVSDWRIEGIEEGKEYEVVTIPIVRKTREKFSSVRFDYTILSDSDLVRWLISENLGTEATRHSYPSKLRERNYITKENLPTIIGTKVSQIIEMLNITPELTRKMEDKLNTLKKLDEINEIKEWIYEITLEAIKRIGELSDDCFILTDSEGHKLRLINTRYGLMAVCDICKKRFII